MRDLIDTIKNILTEDVGLANRREGQSFVNAAGDLITFKRLVFFPDVGHYDSPEFVQQAIDALESKNGEEIKFFNTPNAGTLAFGVATFIDQDNKVIRFGRYFRSIHGVFTANKWKNSDLPDGFKYNSKSSIKMVSGLMPQDVLQHMDRQTADQVLAQVVKFFNDNNHPLVSITNGIVGGQPLPIQADTSKYPDLNFEAFRDYFCEILHPIAIINGLTKGNAAEAEKDFFGKGGFKSAKMTFDTGKNTGLFDSLLISAENKVIKVSSKGGSGAKASTQNLADAISDLRAAGKIEMLNEFKDVVKIISIIEKSGQNDGPLELAQYFSIISKNEAQNVRDMQSAMKSGKIVTPSTATLKQLYNKRLSVSKDASRIVPYFNMLSGVAYAVAEHINTKTNFSEAAATILNHSALIQINTIADNDTKQNRFILYQFTATYPSTVYSKIFFDASKTYNSTTCKGKFTFKIPSGNANLTVSADDQELTQQIDNVVDPHVDMRPKGARELKEPVANKVSDRRGKR